MKPRHATLIFDLDGTLSDPRDGIVRSINYALRQQGYPEHDEEELTRHIGPPLDQSFVELTGCSEATAIHALVASFRERYGAIGYAENHLYDGIPEVLQRLRALPGIRLGVCSSKRVDFVERILGRFGIRDVFEFVSGGEIGVEKWQQLAVLIREVDLEPSALMVGDRAFDVVAAHRNRLDAMGVLWGYGSREELTGVSPRYLLSSVSELEDALG